MITFPVGNDPSLKDELLLSNAVENNTMNSFPWDFQIPLRTAKSWGTFFGSPFSLKRFTGTFIPTIYHNFFFSIAFKNWKQPAHVVWGHSDTLLSCIPVHPTALQSMFFGMTSFYILLNNLIQIPHLLAVSRPALNKRIPMK